MKKIVFDLDNTLIPWEDRYNDAMVRALNSLGSPRTSEELVIIQNSISDYENYYDIHNKIYMKDFFDSRLSEKLPDQFMDVWLSELGKEVPHEQDKELLDLLNELKDNYKMSVLTGWFRDSQVERLKNYGILDYFDEVIGTDQCLNKPNISGFILSCGEYDPRECIMVGDSYDRDIVGARLLGMNAVLIDSNDKYKDYKESKIKRIGELRKFL